MGYEHIIYILFAALGVVWVFGSAVDYAAYLLSQRDTIAEYKKEIEKLNAAIDAAGRKGELLYGEETNESRTRT